MNGQDLVAKAKELKQACLNCSKCELGKTKSLDGHDPHVYAVGNVGSKIFFVAEAPGFDETRLKKPLIGRSGKVFDEYVLGGLGLKIEDVWITNTVLCRPPENRKPTKEELAACSCHLQAQFDLIKPRLVVIMGATPMSVMLGIDSGITKLAGTFKPSTAYKDIDVFILAHPSFIIRTGAYSQYKEHVSILNDKIRDYLR
jgi:uracil-DNA glycosylase